MNTPKTESETICDYPLVISFQDPDCRLRVLDEDDDDANADDQNVFFHDGCIEHVDGVTRVEVEQLYGQDDMEVPPSALVLVEEFIIAGNVALPLIDADKVRYVELLEAELSDLIERYVAAIERVRMKLPNS